MDDEVPLVAAVVLAGLLCACGALVAIVTRRAAQGRLRRNQLAGIRTASTMRSDVAWRRGHAAAVPLSDLGGAAFAAGGLLGLVVRHPPTWAALLLAGVVLGGALLLVGARKAVHAASAAE